MDELIKYVTSLSPNILIISISIILLIFGYVLKNHKIVKDVFNTMYNRRKNKEDLLKTIQENQSELKQIIADRANDQECFLEAQKQLSNKQHELAKSVETISKKIDVIKQTTDKRFVEAEEKNNKHIRAELKDKISQSYRRHHATKRISDIELEALEDLIEDYESAKGNNSFVHSVVQKEMYTWKLRPVKKK